MKLLRFADLKARGVVRNRVTLWRWIRAGQFPPGFLMGPNTRVWTEEEIDQVIEARRAAAREPEAAEA